MRDLRKTQKQLQNFILQKRSSIDKEIIESDNVSIHDRLEIYHNAYYSRLLDALKQDYPVLLAYIDNESFDVLGLQYIHQHPSPYRSIRWFGDTFSEFLRESNLDESALWQVELAEFEWLLTIAFDAPDARVVTLEEMAMIPLDKWPYICFELHPSIQRLTLYWNIVSLWNTYKEENRLIKPLRANKLAQWIIWRKELSIHFYSLSPDEAYLIEAMIANKNFGSICEGLCQWVDEDNVASHAASLLKRFIIDKMLTNIIISHS